MKKVIFVLFFFAFIGMAIGLLMLAVMGEIDPPWWGGKAMFIPILTFIDLIAGLYIVFRLFKAKQTIIGAFVFIPLIYGFFLPIFFCVVPISNVISIFVTLVLWMAISNLISATLTYLITLLVEAFFHGEHRVSIGIDSTNDELNKQR